ncbi:hypothetical protein YC2023_046876 [Brassica napus]
MKKLELPSTGRNDKRPVTWTRDRTEQRHEAHGHLKTQTGPNIPNRHGGCLEIKTEKKSPANASDSPLHLGPKVRWGSSLQSSRRRRQGRTEEAEINLEERRQRRSSTPVSLRNRSDPDPFKSNPRSTNKSTPPDKIGPPRTSLSLRKRELNREEAGHGRKWGGDRRVETLRRPPESKAKEDVTSERRTVGERRKERIPGAYSLLD